MAEVISLETLREALVGDRVAFDKHGTVLELEIADEAGPALLLVSEVTDAVKRLEDDRVVGSVDRGQLWAVDVIVLDRSVLDQLGTGSMRPEEVVEAVSAAGYAWEVSSTTSAP